MNDIRANFRDGVIEDGYMWVFDNCLQAVCKINMETMVMDMVERYEGEEHITVGWIVGHQNKLFMVKTETPGILIYDKNKKRFFERFDAPNVGNAKQDVASVLLYDNTIWIFPVWLENEACCYDLKRGKYYTDHNITRLLKSHESTLGVFSPFYFVEKDILWMVCFGGKVYWKYDLKNGNSEMFGFDKMGLQLSGICCDSHEKWFSFLNSSKLMRIREGEDFEFWDGKDSENRPYSNIVKIGLYIVFMPRFSDSIAVINSENGKIQQTVLKKEKIKTSMNEKMRNYCKYGNNLYMLPYQSENMYKVDGVTGEVTCENIASSFHYELEQVKRAFNRGTCIRENENLGICGLIDFCREESE